MANYPTYRVIVEDYDDDTDDTTGRALPLEYATAAQAFAEAALYSRAHDGETVIVAVVVAGIVVGADAITTWSADAEDAADILGLAVAE